MSQPSPATDLDALVNEAKGLTDKTPADQSPENTRVFELFRQADAAGHPEAQFQLSGCYLRGRGTSVDLSEAEKWLRKAAASGSVNAQVLLGVAYLSEPTYPGIAKDEAMAIRWLEEAAKSQNLAAALLLLQIYEERQDKPREEFWLKRAAQCGCPTSLHRVLKRFREDETLRGNKTERYPWLRIGVENGSVDEEELRKTYADVFALQCYRPGAAARAMR